MNEDNKEKALLEENRMRYQIASTNPKLYLDIFGQEDEEVDDSEVEWTTPESTEEIEEILRAMQGLNAGGETELAAPYSEIPAQSEP
jgi:hypothetical protein